MRRLVIGFSVSVLLAYFAPILDATEGTLVIMSDTTLSEHHTGDIVIGADDVTLDCAGYSVRAQLEHGSAIQVEGRNGVTIKSCHVFNAPNGTGISVTSAHGTTLLNNVVSGPDIGFALKDAHGSFLSGNAARLTYAGFTVWFGAANTLNSNLVTGSGAGSAGFHLRSTVENVLNGNSVDMEDGPNSSGFRLEQSDRNKLTGNTVTRTGVFAAFLIGLSSNNVLTGNTATANQAGLWLAQATGTQVTGNTFSHNGVGVRLWHQSTSNEITNNVISQNSFVGLDVCSDLMPENRIAPNRLIGPQRGMNVSPNQC